MDIKSKNYFNTDASRWLAVQSRNPQAATAFVYCVKTTGVVCRPTCKARLARRSNVIFHDSYADACAAGFRACKRCRPEIEVYDPQKDVVASACRSIAEAEGVENGLGSGKGEKNGVRLEELATKAGLTKSHFHRVFKKITGVTPRIYAVNLRAEKLLEIGSSSPPGGSTPELSSAESSRGDGDMQSASLSPWSQSEVDGVEGLVTIDFESSKVEIAGDIDASGCIYLETLSSTMNQSIFAKDIEYTIQPWASGFVLIAATKDGICWLEAGHSMAELSQSLADKFPLAKITLNTWPEESVTHRTNNQHRMFSTVMEALINPTGRTLDISFDVQ
jgi:methylphosphotriester-DNA--protein-cysteine methyltransferase